MCSWLRHDLIDIITDVTMSLTMSTWLLPPLFRFLQVFKWNCTVLRLKKHIAPVTLWLCCKINQNVADSSPSTTNVATVGHRNNFNPKLCKRFSCTRQWQKILNPYNMILANGHQPTRPSDTRCCIENIYLTHRFIRESTAAMLNSCTHTAETIK